jgi:hypothetical protein
MPQNVTISPGSVSANLTCYGFHLWAEDFLIAAKAYAPGARKGSFVGHFLCCQSLELGLKAFLSLKGMDRGKLARKPYGHSLERLAKEAVGRGCAEFAAITPVDLPFIRVASAWYDTPDGKRFQYFRVVDAMKAFSGAPDYASLEELAPRLQSPRLRQAVLDA